MTALIGTRPAEVKDYQASLEKLRKEAAEAALIRDLATDKTKRELYDRLYLHLNRLADEVEPVSFGLDVLSRDCEGSASGKSFDCCSLGFQAEAGAMLTLRRDPQVCNRPLHVQRAFHRMACEVEQLHCCFHVAPAQ
jgi:hypothetical protein